MKKIVLLFVFAIFSLAKAQHSSDQYLPPTIPPSPNAASLGKYADIPVSLYTGIPQIDIPLYEIKGRKLSLPISLSYHASGIKVDEISSWAGLGWALNAGGIITRVVRGFADEKPNVGYNYWSNSIPDPGQAQNYSETFKYSSALGAIDVDPDIYYFNFAGRTGQFVIDKYGNCLPIPYQNIKIQQFPDENRWVITTEDGIIYNFGNGNQEQTDTHINAPDRQYDESFTSSWYLYRIENRNSQEQINLYYSSENVIQYPTSIVQSVYRGSGQCQLHDWYSETKYDCTVHPIKLDSIVLVNGSLYSTTVTKKVKVDFTLRGVERKDLPSHYALQSINVYDNNNNFVKGYNLFQSYFISDLATRSSIPDFRLRLDSLKEISVGVDIKPSYNFIYHDRSLPNHGSYAQDKWGYFNGHYDNKILVPAGDWFTDGADRDPNPFFNKADALIQIIYPTGGFTTFEYETNTYGYIGNQDASSTMNCGGLRIKKMTDYDGKSHNNDIVKSYLYTMENDPNRSSGVLVADLQFGYMQIASTAYFNPTENHTDVCDVNIRTSTSQSELGTTQGSPVGYRKVTVFYGAAGQNGKTVYTYLSPYDFPDEGVEEYPFAPRTSYDWKRGNVSTIKQYNNQNVLVEEDNNTYSFRSDYNANAVPGVRFGIGENHYVSYNGGYPSFNSASFIEPKYYIIKSEWYYLSGTKKTLYDQNGNNPVVTYTVYNYDNPAHAQLTNVLTWSGENWDKSSTLKGTSFKYPGDYDISTVSDDASKAISAMRQVHMVNTIIEQTEWAFNEITSSTLYTYKENSTGIPGVVGIISPKEVLKLETAQPLSSITLSSINSSGNFTYDGGYISRGSFDSYDAVGNINSFTPMSGITTSYLWGYNDSKLIAEIKKSTLDKILYTSFESDQKGGWYYDANAVSVVPGKTGIKSYDLINSSLTSHDIPAGNYILSFWAISTPPSISVQYGSSTLNTKGSGDVDAQKWTYYEYLIITSDVGAIRIDGVGAIDEVRLYPSDAQMTTYTYNPLIGLTSKCNENNQVTYYEYDTFGRLKLIRDDDGNILEHYVYNYRPH